MRSYIISRTVREEVRVTDIIEMTPVSIGIKTTPPTTSISLKSIQCHQNPSLATPFILTGLINGTLACQYILNLTMTRYLYNEQFFRRPRR